MFLSFSFPRSEMRIPSTFLMGFPKGFTEEQGKQLNLGTHPKDTVGSQTRSHGSLGLLPHPLLSAHGSLVLSQWVYSLQTSFLQQQKYSCHSIPKRHSSPQPRGSSSGLQFQLLWVFSSFSLNSHARREGRRQGQLQRALLSPLQDSWSHDQHSAFSKCQLHNESNSLLSSLFHLLCLHLLI